MILLTRLTRVNKVEQSVRLSCGVPLHAGLVEVPFKKGDTPSSLKRRLLEHHADLYVRSRPRRLHNLRIKGEGFVGAPGGGRSVYRNGYVGIDEEAEIRFGFGVVIGAIRRDTILVRAPLEWGVVWPIVVPPEKGFNVGYTKHCEV